MIMRSLYPILLTVAASVLMDSTVHAQTYRPERPYRGVFASAPQDVEQSLSVNGSAGGGFDNNVAADALFGPESANSDLNNSVKGGVADASGGANYQLNLKALTLAASGSTAVHYYPSLNSQFLRRYYGDVAASTNVTRDFSLNGSLEYAPYSLSSLFPFGASARFPDGGVAPDVDLASSLEHYFTYGGGATYVRHLSSRAQISADYSFQRREKTAFAQDFRHQRFGAQYSYNVAKGIALRAGYHYDDADYGMPNQRFHNHQIDAGVDYNRALSFSRRTTLAFHTGTTAISNADQSVTQYQYNLIGGAHLNHEFGRSWNTDIAYERGVNIDPAWANLVKSDSASATVTGLIDRRVNFTALARATRGNVGGFTETNDAFEAYYGDASLTYALGRHVSIGTSYTYYRHRFDRSVLIPVDYSDSFNRHSVRVFVSVWAPLIQRARRPHAAR
jgi:hypothetical protein